MSDPQILVGFSTTNKLFSRLIRWVTRGRCSHAWIRYWDDTLQQYMVLQAELHGYETIPWARWKRLNILVAAYRPTSNLDMLDGVRFISKYLGVDYDLSSALWCGLKRWIKRRFRRPVRSPGQLMCSEAVCRALQHAKAHCCIGINPELITPKELEDRLRASGEFELVNQEILA